jgi:hypothetical protein
MRRASRCLTSLLLAFAIGQGPGGIAAEPSASVPGPKPTGIYGLRWKRVSDEAKDYALPCERLDAARGLAPSDFDQIAPWSGITRCEVAGQTMVRIPKHYQRREVRDGYEYRHISASPAPGFAIDPAFVENGRILDFIHIGAYEAHLDDKGRLQSKSGVHPTANLTRVQYRAAARANGIGFGLFDLRSLLMLQNLFLIEHAQRNSQQALGNGWGKLLQPARTHRCVLEEAASNRLVTEARGEPNPTNALRGLFIGCAITITSHEQPGEVYASGRLLTKVELNQPKPGQISFHFDGPPLRTHRDMCLGGAAQPTGLSDSIPGHSGQGPPQGDPPDDPYRCAVKYRHLENLWGNLWCFIDGANLSGGKVYLADNMTDYQSGLTSAPYRFCGMDQPMQNDNGDIGGPREIHFLKNLGYLPDLPWLALPQEYTHHGLDRIDQKPAPSLQLRQGNFGDYYYLNDKATCYVHGGGFDHYWRCGLFTLRGWSSDSQRWYLYGARLIHKPLP